MAFQAGYKARVLAGDFSLSAKLTDASFPYEIDMLDVTTFGDNGVKRSIPGEDTSTFSVSGFIDAATLTDAAAWTTEQAFAYAPQGIALASYPVFMVSALASQFTVGTQVAGVASFDMTGQTTGTTDIGKSLHDLTAVTTTENGTAVDGTAQTTNGGVAQLHVTAFSGLTNAIITVQDSVNGTTGWATIATFSTVTAVTSERVAIAGTIKQYTRYVATLTGTGSVTFAVFKARR